MRCWFPQCFVAAALLAGCRGAQQTSIGPASVVSFTLSCAKPEGGFGPAYQPYRGLHWTYFALSVLRSLGTPVPMRAASLEFARQTAGEDCLSEDEYLRSLLLTMLGSTPDSGLAWRVKLIQSPDGGWQGNLTSTFRAVNLLHHLGTRPIAPEQAAAFVADHVTPTGYFDEVPRRGTRSDSLRVAVPIPDSTNQRVPLSPSEHVWNTYCGVQTLALLQYHIPWQARVVAWLRSCQNSDGGFGWRPADGPEQPSDVWYTYLATTALRTMGAPPRDSIGVIDFINACQNADGGFGDRPGRESRLEATSYAVGALAALCGNATHGIRKNSRPVVSHTPGDEWRGLPVNHLYRLSMATQPSGLRSSKRRGVPILGFGNDLTRATPVVVAHALALRDTIFGDVVCELDAPRFIATFSGGNTAPVAVSVRAGNGATPPLIEALETLWTATEPRAPSRRIAWTTFAQQHAEPIARSGGVACYRIEGGDQVQQYLLTEAVASRVRDGACAIAALSDGTDLMRAMPRLERLSGVVPFVVAAADSGDFDRARVVWLGEKQTWTG